MHRYARVSPGVLLVGLLHAMCAADLAAQSSLHVSRAPSSFRGSQRASAQSPYRNHSTDPNPCRSNQILSPTREQTSREFCRNVGNDKLVEPGWHNDKKTVKRLASNGECSMLIGDPTRNGFCGPNGGLLVAARPGSEGAGLPTFYN